MLQLRELADGRYVLYSLIEDDDFAKTLWQIYQEVKLEGYVQVRSHEAFKVGSKRLYSCLFIFSLHLEFSRLLTCPFLVSLEWWDTPRSGSNPSSRFFLQPIA